MKKNQQLTMATLPRSISTDLDGSSSTAKVNEVKLDSEGAEAQSEPSAEVVARARRRNFSNAEKRRILGEADRCTKPGEVGSLMRREGVYSSALSAWRRQREAGALDALAPAKRGPKIDPNRADVLKIAQLTRERDAFKSRLDKALLVIDVQKKLGALLGNPIAGSIDVP
jgi:transposase